MIRLLFVGDGDRDAVTNPHLVATLIGAPVEPEAVPWPHLHGAGKGYDRKLLFAISAARQKGLNGVVATIDKDRSPGRDRLRDLTAARTRDRDTAPSLPTALGCADPHAEAWLLDDPVAVRTVLGLVKNAMIPNVRKVASPKNELTGLHTASPRSGDPSKTVLAEIAQALEPKRCRHAKETGYAHFSGEVRDEIGPLIAPSVAPCI